MIERLNRNTARRARWAKILNRETAAQRLQRRCEEFQWAVRIQAAHLAVRFEDHEGGF